MNAREYNDARKGTSVGDLGIELTSAEPGRLVAQVMVSVRKVRASPRRSSSGEPSSALLAELF